MVDGGKMSSRKERVIDDATSSFAASNWQRGLRNLSLERVDFPLFFEFFFFDGNYHSRLSVTV